MASLSLWQIPLYNADKVGFCAATNLPIESNSSNCTARMNIYTRYKLCHNLCVGQKCFRVQKYSEGIHEMVFHEHVPSHRISQDSSQEVLRTLVVHFAGWSAQYILSSNLNNRRGAPSRGPIPLYYVDYPEEGVVRYTVSGGNTNAWYDKVIAPNDFRSQVIVSQ